jgi:hypothetical protein
MKCFLRDAVFPLKKPYHKKIYFGVTSCSPPMRGSYTDQIRSHARQYLLRERQPGFLDRDPKPRSSSNVRQRFPVTSPSGREKPVKLLKTPFQVSPLARRTLRVPTIRHFLTKTSSSDSNRRRASFRLTTKKGLVGPPTDFESILNGRSTSSF